MRSISEIFIIFEIFEIIEIIEIFEILKFLKSLRFLEFLKFFERGPLIQNLRTAFSRFLAIFIRFWQNLVC